MISDRDVADALERALNDHGYATMVAWGTSMLPWVWPGALLGIEACRPEELEIGDIVVARRGTGLIAHRLVGTAGDHLVCRGDYRDAPDAPLATDAVLGRVSSFPVGCMSIMLPTALRMKANRLLMRATPHVLAGREPARRLLEGIWRSASRSPLSIVVRETLWPWNVRLLTVADLSAVRRAVLRRGIRPTRKHMEAWTNCAADWTSLPFAVIAATVQGGVAGYVRAHSLTDETVVLSDLYVARSHRGAGISKQLVGGAVAHLMRLASSHGIIRVHMDVRRDAPAHHCARSVGFEERPEMSPKSPEHVVMILDVSAFARRHPPAA